MTPRRTSSVPGDSRASDDSTVPDVSIVTSGHDVADARIHRLTEALLADGLDVEILGLGHRAAAPAGSAHVRTVERSSLSRRPFVAIGHAARARGKVLIALDPDALVVAAAVARARGRKVVADVHEDYAALLADRPWAQGLAGAAGRLVVRAADRLARSADLVIVADEHVPPLTGRRRLVLRNVPYLPMLPEAGMPDNPLRALYVGDVRRSRGLFTMLDGVAGSRWRLDIIGPVAAADAETARTHPAVLSGQARLHGRLPPRHAWAYAHGAAVGLSLLDDTPAFREALASKVYEYAAVGLPMIVTDLPRQREFVEARRAGLVLPPPGRGPELAAALARLADTPGLHNRLAAGSRSFRSEAAAWAADYERMAAAIGALVSSVR